MERTWGRAAVALLQLVGGMWDGDRRGGCVAGQGRGSLDYKKKHQRQIPLRAIQGLPIN